MRYDRRPTREDIPSMPRDHGRGAERSARMPPVRVLFLSSYTGLGGGETSLLALLGALDRSRLSPFLLCPREGQLTDAARRLDVDVRVVPWRAAPVWFAPPIWTRAPAVSRLLSCIDDIRPSVLHSEFHALPYVVGAARRRALPVVFTCYGWWFHPRPWQRAFYADRRLSILAISEAVRTGFLGTPPAIEPDRVALVPLGVDTTTFRPRPDERQGLRSAFGLPPETPVVTLVARFQDVKGHDIFLDMASRVRCVNPRTCFVVAGENVFGGSAEEAYKRRVLAMAAGDPVLREAVRFPGWVSRPQDLFAASDVVVCSSRFESFGMTIVEAMASGVPVVSTNVGGPAEIVEDGVTGYLVPPGRSDLLAARVAELLDDPDRRRAFGEAGRRRVLERFTVERYAAAATDLLLCLAAGGASTGSA